MMASENTLFETNNYSTISKYSASKLNYHKDECLELFVESELRPKSWRRTPLVNRGYAARMMAVQWATQGIIDECLIILGAGFDTISLKHISKRRNGHCIEIDLRPVIEAKYQYLVRKFGIQEEDIKISGGNHNVVSFPTLKLHLICCDMRELIDLKTSIEEVLYHIEPHERERVFLLNEVCLCYIEPSEVTQILETLIEKLRLAGTKRITYVGYEQVRPSDTSANFGQIMVDHFSSLGHPLKHFPTRAQLHDMFRRQLHFQEFSIKPMHLLYHNTLLPLRVDRQLDAIEPFDEFEEMDLYLSHYALVIGTIDPGAAADLWATNLDSSRLVEDDTSQLCTQMASQLSLDHPTVSYYHNNLITRFGHASCVLEDKPGYQSILITSGFGRELLPDFSWGSTINLQDHRLSDWNVVHKRREDWSVEQLLPVDFPAGNKMAHVRMHGQICQVAPGCIVATGGRASPTANQDKYPENFTALVGDGQLLCTSSSKQTVPRWRHRILPYQQQAVLEVGGRYASTVTNHSSGQPYNVTITPLNGGEVVAPQLSNDDHNLYARHSFGMDFQDAPGNTFLVFGGLKSTHTLDQAMDFGRGAVLFDLRQTTPARLGYLAPYYDSQVHFIDSNRFLNIGGVSTLTGEPNNFIDMYDLRMSADVEPVERKPLLPLTDIVGVPARRRLIPTKQTSVNFKQSNEIVTICGGGNYFTFGTHFNRGHLIYNYSRELGLS